MKRGMRRAGVAASHASRRQHQRGRGHDVLAEEPAHRAHGGSFRRAKIRDADLVAGRLEAGVELELHGARPRQVHAQHAGDASGPRRHHHHPVGEEDRLRDGVGDEEDRLAPLLPDAQQLEAHLLARHRVERPERLVHQQQARDRAAARGRSPRAAACRPRARAGTGLESGEPGQLQQVAGRLAVLPRGRDPSISTENSTLSSTVRQGRSTGCWKTKPTSGSGRRPAGRRIRMLPLVGGTRPGDQLEQRALAAAARPDQVTNSRSRDLERDRRRGRGRDRPAAFGSVLSTGRAGSRGPGARRGEAVDRQARPPRTGTPAGDVGGEALGQRRGLREGSAPRWRSPPPGRGRGCAPRRPWSHGRARPPPPGRSGEGAGLRRKTGAASRTRWWSTAWRRGRRRHPVDEARYPRPRPGGGRSPARAERAGLGAGRAPSAPYVAAACRSAVTAPLPIDRFAAGRPGA